MTLHTASGLISLSGVLYVPDICSNLLSVASIVEQGFPVEFTKSDCIVSKRNTQRIIGKRQGNIYVLIGLQEIALAERSQEGNHTIKDIWHNRMAHRSLSQQATEQIVKSVTGFDPKETERGEERVYAVCAEGKQSPESLTGQGKKSKELLDTIHSDVCGPRALTGLMGERYFTTFIDEHSRRIGISLLTLKSGVFERFKEYKAKVERETGRKIKSLRCDGGGEYRENIFRTYLCEHGIRQHITPPYTPEHNGIAERANRTIMDMVRCMMFESGIGKEFWEHAALTAVHIINRLPSSAHENRTPFEKWFGSPPSIGHLRVFGCTAYRHVPTQTRRKLDPRAQRCRMIGYQEESGSRVYRVYNPVTKQVLTSRDVVFDVTTTEARQDTTFPISDQEGFESVKESWERRIL